MNEDDQIGSVEIKRYEDEETINIEESGLKNIEKSNYWAELRSAA